MNSYDMQKKTDCSFFIGSQCKIVIILDCKAESWFVISVIIIIVYNFYFVVDNWIDM